MWCAASSLSLQVAIVVAAATRVTTTTQAVIVARAAAARALATTVATVTWSVACCHDYVSPQPNFFLLILDGENELGYRFRRLTDL
jgi:hypothetical protein